MKIRRTIFFASCLALAACQAKEPNSRSIKDVKYQGPTAQCSEIEDVLANPPGDMTDKQNLIATLSRDACALPVSDITVSNVQAILDGKKIAYEVEGGVLTVYASHTAEQAITCCSLQPQLKLIGKVEDNYFFAYRFRLKDLDEARLEFFSPNFMESQDKEEVNYVGENARSNRDFLEGDLEGTLTTASFSSTALNEKRQYSLYVPPGFQPGDKVGLVVIGDGSALGFLVREWEPLIKSSKVGKFVAIGIHSGQRSIVDPSKTYDFDVRNADYIHNYQKGPQRFDQHLSFVVDELIPSVVSSLEIDIAPEETVLMGGSSAGSFALWGALKRPDMFGFSVGMSPSGPVPEEVSDLAAKGTYYISAGLYEPGFRGNAVLYDEKIRQSGAKTDLKTYPDGHSFDHRAQRMVEVLPLIFLPDK